MGRLHSISGIFAVNSQIFCCCLHLQRNLHDPNVRVRWSCAKLASPSYNHEHDYSNKRNWQKWQDDVYLLFFDSSNERIRVCFDTSIPVKVRELEKEARPLSWVQIRHWLSELRNHGVRNSSKSFGFRSKNADWIGNESDVSWLGRVKSLHQSKSLRGLPQAVWLLRATKAKRR